MSVQDHITLDEIDVLAADAAVRIDRILQYGGSPSDMRKIGHIIQMAIAKAIGRERQAGVQS